MVCATRIPRFADTSARRSTKEHPSPRCRMRLAGPTRPRELEARPRSRRLGQAELGNDLRCNPPVLPSLACRHFFPFSAQSLWQRLRASLPGSPSRV
ncbi:hypothetical protein CLOM_g11252 [Closterium sp. NIES-68]|nr:hypothetical protein CLOM_g11252 [Closterium sp. NIES-68]